MFKYSIAVSLDLVQEIAFTLRYSQKELQYLVARRLIVIATSILLIVLVSSSLAADQSSIALQSWDEILTGDFFNDIAKFNRIVQQKGSERVYVYSTFTDAAAGGKSLISIVVAVGPAGKRLDPDVWNKAFAASSDIEKMKTFPTVGVRAQVQTFSFSPDGALSGVVFTTADESFDVLVSLYEVSSTAPGGGITANDMAHRIESAYLGAVGKPLKATGLPGGEAQPAGNQP